MASGALKEWTGARKRRLQHLWELKRRAALPWQERQIYAALVVHLATEFQGFARDLHDEGVDFLADTVSPRNPQVKSALRVGLAANRVMDRGNVNKDALGKDFNRLGFIFWSALDAAQPRQSLAWKKELNKLIEMRNAVAHEDLGQIARLRSEGYLVSEAQVKAWEQDLDTLAVAMDDVVGSSLAALLNTARPW